MSSASMLAMERGAGRGADLPQGRLERMFVELHPVIWRTLRRLGLPPWLAAEVTRQVFLQAAKDNGGVPRHRERVLLLALAVSQLSRTEIFAHAEPTLRLAKAYPSCAGVGASSPSVALHDAGAASAPDQMDRVLMHMSRPGVVAFVLFELEGLSLVEVAEVMAVDADTALRALMQAREEFTVTVAELREASRR